MSIKKKILISTLVVALSCSIILGFLGIIIMRSFVENFNSKLLDNSHALAISILEDYKIDAQRSSTLAAEDNSLIVSIEELFSSEQRDSLVDVSISIMRATGVDFLTVLDASGNVLVRAHEPDNFGDSLAKQENVKRAMAGNQYTTIEAGTAVKMSVRCGTPVHNINGEIIGVISLGFRLDQNEFVDYIKKMTKTEATVFLNDIQVSTTVLNENNQRLADTQANSFISEKVLSGNKYIGREKIVENNLLTYYSPIRDTEGDVLGMLFIGLNTSETDNRMKNDTILLIASTFVLGLMAVLISLRVASRISLPIKEMSDTAKLLAAGNIDVKINVSASQNSKDETVLLGHAFSELIESNRERARIIRTIADGDMSGIINLKSDKDVIGYALSELLDKNNNAFSGMNETAEQLNIESTHVSDGAQHVARGSMEQSATIERLHETLQDLSDKTTKNAKQAGHAANLSNKVKELAEKGSQQMDYMMEAVGQISEASVAIGTVMKTIDDIAFQTNILALNAAVEAARAGQHGKGFAVVAEEVRNLAAKSAEAAKNTESLIANSIEKANLGSTISKETAESFAEIVNGISESNIIISEIAGFSKIQNTNIENIANDVNSIGSIVQSVSASAQQSAASSEEMSSMAETMAETLSNYKLRKKL